MSKKQPEKRYYVIRWKPDKSTYTSYSENEFVLKKDAARLYKILKHFHPEGTVKVLYKVEEFISEEQLFWNGKFKRKEVVTDESIDFDSLDLSDHIEKYIIEDEPKTYVEVSLDNYEEEAGLVINRE